MLPIECCPLPDTRACMHTQSTHRCCLWRQWCLSSLAAACSHNPGRKACWLLGRVPWWVAQGRSCAGRRVALRAQEWQGAAAGHPHSVQCRMTPSKIHTSRWKLTLMSCHGGGVAAVASTVPFLLLLAAGRAPAGAEQRQTCNCKQWYLYSAPL